MKNIYHKVKIQPLFYLFLFLVLITGQVKTFISLMIVILFHELGHIIVALIFKWNIKKIIILPFGCMTEFQEKLNRPIYQEFLILIAGPIFQIILSFFYHVPFSYPLLLFNLLPIYPLDGSKLVFLLCNIICSYYYSYIITFFVSYLFIFLLIIKYHNFMILLFSIYLLISSIDIYLNRHINFYIFLYERLKYPYIYYKEKVIMGNNLKKMKRDVKYYFLIENSLKSEQKVIKNKLNLTNV
jgi:stage IV sporulation protein FB